MGENKRAALDEIVSERYAQHVIGPKHVLDGAGPARWGYARLAPSGKEVWLGRTLDEALATVGGVTIVAPATPGASPTKVWAGRSTKEAEGFAESEFGSRRDLSYQDVVIYVGEKRVAYAGPTR
ncbi:MAG TPA: hypothetical protein VGI39_05425 [Polyangiaceae bacterium]|jgi:hypothetical protein